MTVPGLSREKRRDETTGPSLWVAVGLLFAHLIPTALAAADQSQRERPGVTTAGEILLVAGKAQIRLVPEGRFRTANPGQVLAVGDVIQTGVGGRVAILLNDQTQLKLAGSTTMVIKAVAGTPGRAGVFKTLLKLESGEVWSRTKGTADGLEIESPNATATIRGTEWSFNVDGPQSRVIVMEGRVQVANDYGTVLVSRNETATVSTFQAPVKNLIVRPRDHTQWTHYLSEKKLLGYFTGLGLIEIQRGRLDEAENYLDRSLAGGKHLLSLLGKSYLLIAANRTDEAAVSLQEAVQLFSDDPRPYIFLSYLQTFLGDFTAALRVCDLGLARLPDNPLLLTFKVDLAVLLDQPREAQATLSRLLRLPLMTPFLKERAANQRAPEARGTRDDAPANEETLVPGGACDVPESVTAANPEAAAILERFGFFQRMFNGAATLAEKAWNCAAALDGANDEALAKLADLYREQGRYDKALLLMKKAEKLAPWNPMHSYNRGRLLADIRNVDEARRAFEHSLELDPSFSRAYLGKGIVLLLEGRTEQALQELSKAALLEPGLAEAHSFLAIAHYQRQAVAAALDELQRAEECDPLDATPHQLASAILDENDQPAQAITEARRVLQLLPYRKASGQALLDATQRGTLSVNEGLNQFDLPEWSLFYAQKALAANPYTNTSHIGVATAYEKLGEISALQGYNEFTSPAQSELLQGLALNVNALGYSNRYSSLIQRPGHNLTWGLSGTPGSARELQTDLEVSGDFGPRLPLTYSLSGAEYTDQGYLKHSFYEKQNGELLIGYRPGYDRDLYLYLYGEKGEGEAPRQTSLWYRAGAPDWEADDNQRHDSSFLQAQTGYHLRLGPESHLLAAARYAEGRGTLTNPDAGEDLSGFASAGYRNPMGGLGLRHLFSPGAGHQLSYGLDYFTFTDHYREKFPYSVPDWVEEGSGTLQRTSVVLHLYDRWSFRPGMNLDIGLLYNNYLVKSDWTSIGTGVDEWVAEDETSSRRSRLNPQIGMSLDLCDRGVLRLAYQRRSTPIFLGVGELTPVGIAGLIPPSFDIEFSDATDWQGSLEYEITDQTFIKVLAGYLVLSDVPDTGDADTGPVNLKADMEYSRFSLNHLFGRHFSASLRYHQQSSRYRDGSGRELPGIPPYVVDARLVFVDPQWFHLRLRSAVVGPQYTDSSNTSRLDNFWVSDVEVSRELFAKRLLLSVNLNNIFDQHYSSMTNPYNDRYWWYGEALPARGRTLMLRVEFRL